MAGIFFTIISGSPPLLHVSQTFRVVQGRRALARRGRARSPDHYHQGSSCPIALYKQGRLRCCIFTTHSPIGGQRRRLPTKGHPAKTCHPKISKDSPRGPSHTPEYQLSLTYLYSTKVRVGPVRVSELVGLATHARSSAWRRFVNGNAYECFVCSRVDCGPFGIGPAFVSYRATTQVVLRFVTLWFDAPCGIRTLITDLEVAEGAFKKENPFLLYRPN